MQALIDIEGWQLFWTCAGIGIILAGLIVAFGVFIDVAMRLGYRDGWRDEK